MKLRPATMDDAQRLYEWRNDPSTREHMHQTGSFDFASHCAWLERSLAMPTRKLYVAEVDNVPVGTIRMDLNDGATEFSWTIAPEYRRRGLGKEMARYAIAQVSGPIHVEVKATNIVSAKIAEAAGLIKSHELAGVIHFVRP